MQDVGTRWHDRRTGEQPFEGAEQRIADRHVPYKPPLRRPPLTALSEIDLWREYERTKDDGTNGAAVVDEIERRRREG